MWPDRVSNPGPLTYVSGALPTALRGPALMSNDTNMYSILFTGKPLNVTLDIHLSELRDVDPERLVCILLHKKLISNEDVLIEPATFVQ